MNELQMRLETRHGTTTRAIPVHELVIGGWTGRDKQAMEAHIEELVALGVSRPESTPTYYHLSAARLSTATQIEVPGTTSSGEAEFLLTPIDGELYVGLGSDHTDREVEAYGVTVSKQVCDKPVAPTLWPYREVKDHWDELVLRSHVTIDGERQLYQEGSIAGMLSPEDLISDYRTYNNGHGLQDGCVLFGGTIPALGGIRPAAHFEAEIEDPVLGRRIRLAYGLKTLPVNG